MSKPFKQSFGITSPSFLTLIFVLVFTFVLSGCGGGGGSARMETPMMPPTGPGDGSGGGETGMMPVVDVSMSTEEFSPLPNAVERDHPAWIQE